MDDAYWDNMTGNWWENMTHDNWWENMTYPEEYFGIGWFRFPLHSDENYAVIEILHDILNVINLFTNPFFLWMIVKNPGNPKRKNTTILLANLCLVNLIIACTGVVHLFSRRLNPDDYNIVSYKAGAIVMSIMLPKYYATVFLLSLSYYGLIVKPLKFMVLAPQKMLTMVGIIICIWIGTTATFLIPPLLVDDFDSYMKILVTIMVSACWVVTIVMVVMFVEILRTLRQRTIAFKTTFNMGNPERSLVVIKQNIKLAKVLFIFITVLVLSTLPIYTSYMFILHCPQWSQRTNIKFCLYMTPVFLGIPTLHPIHWLIGTPQYFKELKRLGRRMLVFCRLVKED